MNAPRETNHAWKHDPHGMGSLLAFCDAIILPSLGSDRQRSKYRTAIVHLSKFLSHDPGVADLSSDNLRGLISDLLERGRRFETVKEVRAILLAIARQAQQHELLNETPQVPLREFGAFKLPRKGTLMVPWGSLELDRMFGSARTMPGDVGGIASRRWWPALLLTLLDTGATIRQALDAPKSAYDARCGELSIGLFKYALHPLAIEAINAILPHAYDKLFPFPLHLSMVFRRMKHLLFRAELPHVTFNLFERLRVTHRDAPGALNRLNLFLPFVPRNGIPYLPRARDRRVWERVKSPEDPAIKKTSPTKAKKPESTESPSEPLIRITIDSPKSLMRFANEAYIPQRLSDAAELTRAQLRSTIDRYGTFLSCDPTFDHLDEDLVERFLAWVKTAYGYENATVNGHRCRLLALWRHAWRKRKVVDLPRDITKLKVPKLVPEAWSLDEMFLILKAAGEVEGDVCEIPAGRFWTALILTLYCTGLRISALMQLRVTDFNFDSRWLKVPAAIQKQDADQVFRLPPETVAVLAATNPANREWLFPWPYDPTGWAALTSRYRKILKAAGLKSGKRDLFHKIRRTSATAVCQVMGRLATQEHLGHSCQSVTDRYIDPTKLTIKESPSERIAQLAIPAPRSSEVQT